MIRNIFNAILMILTVFLSLLIIGRGVSTALLPFLDWDILYIFSYLPPHIALVLSGVYAGVLFVFNRKKIISYTLVCTAFFSYALDGDHSIKQKLFANKKAYANTELVENNFSVLALNVQFYWHSFDKVFRFLKEHQADVILLSENQFRQDQKNKLFASKEYFLKDYNWPSKNTYTTIMSKYNIISYENIELPSPQVSIAGFNEHTDLESLPRRQFAHAKIKIGNKLVNFISLRFVAGRARSHDISDQIPWALKLFQYQKQEVAFIKDYLAKLAGPLIVGGDLNLPPGSGFIRDITQNLIDASKEHSLFGGRTFRNEFVPMIRLDYLLHSPDLVNLETKILNKEKVSDHFALIGKFSI